MFVEKLQNKAVHFSNGYPLPAHTANKWFNCCGELYMYIDVSHEYFAKLVLDARLKIHA